MKKTLFGLGGLATTSAAAAFAMSLNAAPVAADAEVTLYKNPQCGCCEKYVDYLRENGFEVEVKPTHELSKISREARHSRRLPGLPHGFLR